MQTDGQKELQLAPKKKSPLKYNKDKSTVKLIYLFKYDIWGLLLVFGQ